MLSNFLHFYVLPLKENGDNVLYYEKRQVSGYQKKTAFKIILKASGLDKIAWREK